jgi:mono/diheme cytochrome c family protein
LEKIQRRLKNSLRSVIIQPFSKGGSMFRTLFATCLVLFLITPVFAQKKGDIKKGEEKFKQLCASCHGDKGKGDGPAGKALNPPPRNFTDPKWQKSVDDARIRKVIKEGGASVGLSPLMAPFGSVLSEADLDNLVAFIRSFGGEQKGKK